MADKTPNWEVEKRRLVRQKMQVELNVFDCETRIKEIVEEKRRLEENIAASAEALKDLEVRINGIHVEVTPDG